MQMRKLILNLFLSRNRNQVGNFFKKLKKNNKKIMRACKRKDK